MKYLVLFPGLEITQNNIRMNWSADEVNGRLKNIMKDIHERCVKYGKSDQGTINYAKGVKYCRFQESGGFHACFWAGIEIQWMR